MLVADASFSNASLELNKGPKSKVAKNIGLGNEGEDIHMSPLVKHNQEEYKVSDDPTCMGQIFRRLKVKHEKITHTIDINNNPGNGIYICHWPRSRHGTQK